MNNNKFVYNIVYKFTRMIPVKQKNRRFGGFLFSLCKELMFLV